MYDKIAILVKQVIVNPNIAKFYSHFISRYSLKHLIDYFYLVFYGTLVKYKLTEPKPLNLFIDHSKFSNKIIITNKLKFIFGNSINIFEKYNDNIDIIISDLPNTRNSKYTFSIASYSDKKDFDALLFKILELRKKLFNERYKEWDFID